MENKKSEDVIHGGRYAKEDVEVTGRVFENAHVIDLENIRLVEEESYEEPH